MNTQAHTLTVGTEKILATAAKKMKITKVVDTSTSVTVTWDCFSEFNLTGFIVSLLEIGTRMDNAVVDNPNVTTATIAFVLKAGASYQCWITPLLSPGMPDIPAASDPVSIPYP